MRLKAPELAPELGLTDLDGFPVSVGTGKPLLLSFFRDAACPFCNLRIYELTKRHPELAKQGLRVIAVFASEHEAVKRFVLQRPRPFLVVADPKERLYQEYGIEKSLFGKLKAISTRIKSLIQGLKLVGLAGLNTNNNLPADFLIDGTGRIVTAYYGKDAGDRLPFEAIEQFLRQQKAKR